MNEFTLIFLLTLGAGTALKVWLAGRQIRHVLRHRDRVPVPFAAAHLQSLQARQATREVTA